MKSVPANESRTGERVPATRSPALLERLSGGGAVAYLFLLPSLVFLAVFTLWPIISVIRTSFLSRRGRRHIFVGLDNYERIFSDPISQQVIQNTLAYVTFGLVLSVVGGLLLAILMNQGLRIGTVMTTD